MGLCRYANCISLKFQKIFDNWNILQRHYRVDITEYITEFINIEDITEYITEYISNEDITEYITEYINIEELDITASFYNVFGWSFGRI